MCYLEKVTPGKSFWTLLEAMVARMWKDRQGEIEVSLKRWKAVVRSLEERRGRVFEMREDGSYTKEEFQRRHQGVKVELTEARENLASCQLDNFDPTAALKYAEDFLTAWSSQWLDLVPEWRSRFQHLIFPEGIPYSRDSGFGTAKLGFIYEVNQRFVATNSKGVDLRGVNWNLLLHELKEYQNIQRVIKDTTEV